MKKHNENFNDGYYHLREDLENYPDAWCYLIFSERGPGKTYSTLRYMEEEKIKHVFLKRTIEDVDFLCSGSGKIGTKINEYSMDLSPYVPLNRDFNWNIKPFTVHRGLGGFWHCNEDNEPVGEPCGYLLANNAIQKFKGFDLSDAEFIIFDEFIPQQYERINREEGKMVLDLYKTVERDRLVRGKNELKLVCLANSTMISNPVFNTLEVTDIVSEMQERGVEVLYLEDRGILLHHITKDIDNKKQSDMSGIEKAMHGTEWYSMAYGGNFAYDDFSNVNKYNLKKFEPYIELKYKKSYYYIYMKESFLYMCESRSNKCQISFDLNKENDQKRFWIDYGIDLREACIEDRMKFQKYTMYDLIVNYKKFFKL